MPRVFLSSTSRDLESHRRAARDVIDRSLWDVEWMERFGTSTAPTRLECEDKVRQCDLVLLLIAFRYGAAPPGCEMSYTQCEVAAARRYGIPIRALMAHESWPGNLWEADRGALQKVIDFRANWGSIAEFFEYEPPLADPIMPLPRFAQVVRKAIQDHKDQVQRLRDQLDIGALAHVAGNSFPVTRACNEIRMLIDGRVLAPLWVIRDAYRRSHPTGDTLLATNDSVAALVEAVRSLALLPPQQYGTHPLCDFLCGVAQQSEGERARLLLGCAARISPEALAQKPGGGMVATEPARPDLPPLPPPPSARVVVRFEPGRMDPSEQVVTAWLCAGDAPRRLALEQTTWTSADRASRLAELHAEILSNVADPAATLIEFVVPRTLISQEFDQWEMSSPELGYIGRLVDDFPLVVRPLERSRNALARSRLEARWKAIRAHLGAPCHVREVGQVIGQDTPQALWIADHRCGDQLFQVLGVDQRVACAVLRRAPQGQFSERGMDVFKALLLRGVPIMLWPRRTPRSTALDQQLLDLVNGQRLATLPDIVHQQRRGARSAPLGAHLTLIWDDPTRPIPEPEVVPLLSPAMG